MKHSDSLNRFIILMLRKCKFLVVMIILGGLIGVTYRVLPLLNQPHSTENEQSEIIQAQIEQINSQLQYYQETDLLQIMDSSAVPTVSTIIFISNDYKINPQIAMQDRDRLSDILSAYASIIAMDSIREAINETLGLQIADRDMETVLNVTLSGSILTITVTYPDLDDAQNILDTIISSSYELIGQSVAAHSIDILSKSSGVFYSPKISGLQISRLQTINDLETQKTALLQQTESPVATLQDSLEGILTTGIICAIGFFGLAVLLCMFVDVVDLRLQNINDFNDCGVAAIAVLDYRNKISLIERLCSRLSGETPVIPAMADQMQILGTQIQSSLPPADGTSNPSLLFTGSARYESIRIIADELRQNSQLGDFKIIDAGSILLSGEAVRKTFEPDYAILVETLGTSYKGDIEKEIKILNEQSITVLGAVAVFPGK